MLTPSVVDDGGWMMEGGCLAWDGLSLMVWVREGETRDYRRLGIIVWDKPV